MDDTEKDPPPTLGTSYRGQPHPVLKTPEMVQAEIDAQAPYNKEGAVPLQTYCATRGMRDPVMYAGMRAYTVIERATLEDWDAIFKDF